MLSRIVGRMTYLWRPVSPAMSLREIKVTRFGPGFAVPIRNATIHSPCLARRLRSSWIPNFILHTSRVKVPIPAIRFERRSPRKD